LVLKVLHFRLALQPLELVLHLEYVPGVLHMHVAHCLLAVELRRQPLESASGRRPASR